MHFANDTSANMKYVIYTRMVAILLRSSQAGVVFSYNLNGVKTYGEVNNTDSARSYSCVLST